MAKRLDSPYLPGKRSPAWRKAKARLRQEFVIGGWQPGEGNREGYLGSLLVGVYEGGRVAVLRQGRHRVQEHASSTGWAVCSAAREIDASPFDPPPPRLVAA